MKYSPSVPTLNDPQLDTTGNDQPQALPSPFPTSAQNNQLTLAWIGPTSGPLKWCFQQLSAFAAIRTWNHLEDWLATPQGLKASCDRLVVAMDWRDPELTSSVNQLPHLDPTLPIACLLPDNWLGHRRSHTPAMTIPAFYWWQLQDGLIPWLLAGEKNGLPSSSLWPFPTRAEQWIHYSNLQKNLAPPTLSLFIAETPQLIEIYREFLHSLGGQTQHHQACYFELPDHLRTTPSHQSINQSTPQSFAHRVSTPPQTELQIVWWAHQNIHYLPSNRPRHLKQTPSTQTTSIQDEQAPWHRLALQTHTLFNSYPYCQVGWITTAPNWNQFQLLQQVGFTRILVPPFHLNGLLTMNAK
ncbi:MAG: hypothetical protein RLY14_915 [Planctomycetota bacterium]|jgi:hypothetical protein